MKPNKLRTLLLLVGLLGTIASLKAKESVKVPPDSIICLKPKEFDFYALSVVQRNALRRDTTTLRTLIKSQLIIILKQDQQLEGDKIIITAKDSSIAICKRYFYKEEKTRIKSEKHLKLFKNLTLIFVSVTVILVGLLIVK